MNTGLKKSPHDHGPSFCVAQEAKAISNDSQSNLAPSDVISAVNLIAVSSVAELESALEKIKPGTPIVLQVERKSEFIYLPVNPE